MGNHRRSLDELLSDLPSGLLDEARTAPKARPARADRYAFFGEINAFFEAHGRAPDPTAKPGSAERSLGLNLLGAQRDPVLRSELSDLDKYGLLDQPAEGGVPEPSVNQAEPLNRPNETDGDQVGIGTSDEITSLDDILADDELMSILTTGSEADDVFEMVHVESNNRNRSAPDEIAEREVCDDFDFFEPLFKRMRQRIKDGVVTVEPFRKEGQIEVGDYFFLRGQMCLVDDIDDSEMRDGAGEVYRLRVVFDNGTEMWPYKHSLGRALLGQRSRGYERGHRIIDPDVFADRFNGVSHRDRSKGFIYVLRSKRQEPVISNQRDLYKVGLTARSIKDRLQNAEQETTYLEGPVELVAEWEIYGANLRRVERLLHAFLEPRRCAFSLIDSSGRTYRPREWFNVPYPTIKRAAEAILDGSITSLRLNPINGEILRKGDSGKLDDGEI